MSLTEVKFPEKGFAETETTQAKEFIDYMIHSLGASSVANTLRTTYMARQKQNLLMKVARETLRRVEGK